MAEQGTATKPTNIDNAFAQSERDLRANRPFFGAVSRIVNGQQVMCDYVQKNDRITLPKWLEQKDISQGNFILETFDAEGNDLTIEFMVDKTAKSTTDHPFLRNMPSSNNGSSAVQDELEAQVLRLKGEVEDLTRKRREAEDELYKYKRENSDETGDLKEEHRKEIDTLKEAHRKEVDGLKEDLRQKDWANKMLEIEQLNENGKSTGWDRFLDMVQNNFNDDFFANLLTMIQQQSGGLQNTTPQQLQTSFNQAAAQQMPQQNGGSDGSNPSGTRNNPETPQPEQEQLSPEQQMEQQKNTVADHLKKMALDALMDNVEYSNYANAVRQQLVLNKQHGIKLDAKQWVEMAKMLSEKALEENMSAEKVAKVIEPAIDMLPQQARMMMGLIKPSKAAEKLFEMYDINVSGKVKELVIDVLDQLLNGTTKAQN